MRHGRAFITAVIACLLLPAASAAAAAPAPPPVQEKLDLRSRTGAGAPATSTRRPDALGAARLGRNGLVLHNIKKLPILDEGRLAGIVTFSDFAQLAPAYSDFFTAALGEADRHVRERFERQVHGPADPWTFV